jgi:hypothetical protein
MRNKIVGIVVLMLVATTVVSATNMNVKEKIQPTSSSVDVPVWQKEDSWTYNYHWVNYKYDSNGTLWYTLNYNCTMTSVVTDDTGDNYTMKETSTNIDGRATIGKYQLKFTPFTKKTNDVIFQKIDLGCFSEIQQEKGLVFWLIGNILPFPAQYQHIFEYSDTPAYRFLPFPLNAGTNGTIPGGSQIWREKASLYWGLISLFDWPEKTNTYGGTHYHCEMANITVPAGTYNAYNVSIDLSYGLGRYHVWRYYVPEVGNQAKLYFSSDWDNTGKPGTIVEFELVSTTYTP